MDYNTDEEYHSAFVNWFTSLQLTGSTITETVPVEPIITVPVEPITETVPVEPIITVPVIVTDGSLEEEDYDEKLVTHGLEVMYGKTKDSPLWQELYIKAAATFLTEDPGVGLPVLLSFTYMRHLIPLYQVFIEKGSEDTDYLHKHQLLMQMFR